MLTSVCLDIEDNQVHKLLCIPLEAIDMYLEFEFELVGEYHPASRFEPAEYPDLEGGDIKLMEVSFEDGSVVTLNDKQINQLGNILTKKQIDLMDDACWNFLDKDLF